MSIFGSVYDSGDLLVITDDLDMDGNRIKELRNPADAFDAANKRYVKSELNSRQNTWRI